MAERLPDIDDLGTAELKRLLLEALAKIAELSAENAALRAEIARLKGLKGRPAIRPGKPSGMEEATSPRATQAKGKRRRRGRQERVIEAAVPGRFALQRLRDLYLVQDLE